eukprot:80495_1
MNIFDMQRIAAFNKAAKRLGLPQHASFEGGDLRDGNNMTAVLNGLYSFGRTCNNKNIAKGGITAAPNKGAKLQDIVLDEVADKDDTNKNKKKPKTTIKSKSKSRKMKTKTCKTCGQ